MNTYLERAHEIGRQYAIKEATSRWREAIRSGELHPETAETLKTRMGVTPEGWSQKLMDASRTMTERAGLPYYVHSEASVKGAIRRLFQKDPKAALELGGAALTTAAGPVTHPILGVNIPDYQNPKLDRLGRIAGVTSLQDRKSLQALAAGHEGYEALGMTRGGKQKTLQEIGQRIQSKGMFNVLRSPEAASRTPGLSGMEHLIRRTAGGFGAEIPEQVFEQTRPLMAGKQLSGKHISAQPPLWDVRESRMFPQELQQKWKNVRTGTGEIDRMQRAGAQVNQYGVTQLPRKSLPQIGRSMERSAVKDMQHAFTQPPTRGWQIAGNIGEGVGRGIQTARSTIGPFAKNLMKLLGR